MQYQKFVSLVAGVALCLIILTGVVLCQNSSANSHQTNSYPAAAVITPISTSTPIPTPASSSAPTSSSETQVGQAYDRPYSKDPIFIKVIRVAATPLVSQDVAVKALTNFVGGLPYATDNNSVTISATYGLVTQGQRLPNGTWEGEQNIRVANCTVAGKCTPTGQVLDHIENRLMWVIDFGGVSVSSSSQICNQGGTCTVPAPHRHAVYLIDATTLQVIMGTSY